MWDHCIEKHQRVEQNFNMKVIDTCRNDSMKRKILEAIHINDNEQGATMNNRTEWNFIRLPRLEIAP